MKVLLISANRLQTPHPVYPLGLDYLRGALAARHEVAIADLNAEGFAGLSSLLARLRPGLVGISIRNIDNVDSQAVRSFLPDYQEVCRRIRREAPVPIVLGGAGFSLFPEALMALLDADYGVIGAGEQLAPLVDVLDEGKDPAGLPGIIARGGRAPEPVPWLGMPRRQLDPGDGQWRYYLERGGIMNLQTQRGCPFRCIYCSYPHLDGPTLRPFPPESVAREAKALEELGARYLFVTDSAFNADEGHSLAVAEAFRREGLKVPWGAFLAPRRPGPGYYETLAEAGMTHAEFGTESLCDAQLEGYGKPFRSAEVLAAHRAAREAGLHCAHYFLLGGPGEDADTVAVTLEQMERLERAVFFVFCGIRILPHTPLYERALREGQIGPGEDLLEPRFYQAGGIAPEGIRQLLEARARGRFNWICGDGGEGLESVLNRLYARGHSGPLWERLAR